MGPLGKEMREWADNGRKNEAGERQVGDDHKPTVEELNNITYLSMKWLINWPMRDIDFVMIYKLAGEINTLKDIDEKFIPTLAEYMWDHVLGEPEDPTIDDIAYGITALKDSLYKMGELERNDVKTHYDQN
jgi:hypothetical protein